MGHFSESSWLDAMLGRRSRPITDHSKSVVIDDDFEGEESIRAFFEAMKEPEEVEATDSDDLIEPILFPFR